VNRLSFASAPSTHLRSERRPSRCIRPAGHGQTSKISRAAREWSTSLGATLIYAFVPRHPVHSNPRLRLPGARRKRDLSATLITELAAALHGGATRLGPGSQGGGVSPSGHRVGQPTPLHVLATRPEPKSHARGEHDGRGDQGQTDDWVREPSRASSAHRLNSMTRLVAHVRSRAKLLLASSMPPWTSFQARSRERRAPSSSSAAEKRRCVDLLAVPGRAGARTSCVTVASLTACLPHFTRKPQ